MIMDDDKYFLLAFIKTMPFLNDRPNWTNYLFYSLCSLSVL
jgi:hypothetical protein